jgi:organic hydroperoxide reductase OsmC/OhrA
MNREHHYSIQVTWTGNKGEGTSGYRSYERSHTIGAANKPDIEGSSDAAFRGDRTKYNPEDMLVASVSACHMLWYLHLCADAGVIVTAYTDNAAGIMTEGPDETGRFREVILYPRITLKSESMVEQAKALHQQAHKFCFIANSCNFPIKYQPVYTIQEQSN